MASPEYSDLLLEHSRHPRNAGAFAVSAPDIGTALVGTPENGAVIQLQIQVQAGLPAQIKAARFKAYGDTATIAAASLMTEWLHGKTLEEAQQLTSSQLVQALAVPPARVFGAMLVQDAVRSAIAHYTRQNPASQQSAALS